MRKNLVLSTHEKCQRLRIMGEGQIFLEFEHNCRVVDIGHDILWGGF